MLESCGKSQKAPALRAGEGCICRLGQVFNWGEMSTLSRLERSDSRIEGCGLRSGTMYGPCTLRYAAPPARGYPGLSQDEGSGCISQLREIRPQRQISPNAPPGSFTWRVP